MFVSYVKYLQSIQYHVFDISWLKQAKIVMILR